jgi:hypothetical protein
MRTLFFLGLAIIIGFGAVAAFVPVPGLVTFDKEQIRKSTSVKAAVRKSSGSKPKTKDGMTPGSAVKANVKVKKARDAGENAGKDLSGTEEIEKILDGEESVQFRKKMKKIIELIERAWGRI